MSEVPVQSRTRIWWSCCLRSSPIPNLAFELSKKKFESCSKISRRLVLTFLRLLALVVVACRSIYIPIFIHKDIDKGTKWKEWKCLFLSVKSLCHHLQRRRRLRRRPVFYSYSYLLQTVSESRRRRQGSWASRCSPHGLQVFRDLVVSEKLLSPN